MSSFEKILGACLVALPLMIQGCGDDDDGGGKSGDGDVGDGDGDQPGDGDGDNPGDGDGDNPGDGDGDNPETCDLSGEGKTVEVIPSPTGNLTLTSDKVWKIQGVTYVADGQTLTVEPCTRIEGAALTAGQPSVLVVSRGGKIDAAGTADRPILFTGENSKIERLPGNWGGVVLLGKAPNNNGTEVLIEGLENAPQNKHGGTVADDNSGTLTYVRIEDPGYELTTDVEINGLTFGSVGSGTVVHHIQVVNSQDDCFEWFGGTVNADHLIAEGCGDDMFDMDLGYTGTVHTLLGRQRAAGLSSSDPNGFELDTNPAGTGAPSDPSPVTRFHASKVTLCGIGQPGAQTSYGGVLRRGVKGAFDELVITGFDAGFSIRNDFGTPAEPHVTIANAKVFGNVVNNLGAPHSSNMGFEPSAWFAAGTGNSTPEPAPFSVTDCQGAQGPAASVTGSGIGAFKDEANWLQGPWVEWSTL